MKLTLGGNTITMYAESCGITIRVEDDKLRVAEIYLEKDEAKTLATAIIEATRTIKYHEH